MTRPVEHGEALWVTPAGKAIFIEEEHPDWLRALGDLTGLSPAELASDDANYYAIRAGWARVVLFEEGQRSNIAARDWPTLRRAFAELVRLRWASSGPASQLAVDIYGDDPTMPDESTVIRDLRAFLRAAPPAPAESAQTEPGAR